MHKFQTAQEALRSWGQRLEAGECSVRELGKTWLLCLSGPTQRRWSFDFRSKPVLTELFLESHPVADATVLLSETEFVRIANKEITPQDAFLSGSIKAAGDTRSVLLFSTVLAELIG